MKRMTEARLKTLEDAAHYWREWDPTLDCGCFNYVNERAEELREAVAEIRRAWDDAATVTRSEG